jgi:RNA polymerase sigma-70 factor (family 1)
MTKTLFQPSDEELVERLASADERAFKEIYNRYGKRVYHTALRFLRSPEIARDVVQDVFFLLWEKKEQFVHIQSLEGYLTSTTQHHVYGLFRKWASETRKNSEYSIRSEDIVDDTDFSLRSLQYEELLGELVDRLPPQQKLVFTMSRNRGMTHEAIAHELNITPGTVKNHMMKALQFLKKHLTPHLSSYLLLTSLLV